jgi:signal-transduction protein with cAMP-binding, CBS, and nucleotidyltransferase domain
MARTVGDVMTRDPATVESMQPVQEAARLMRDADTGALIVLDHGDVTGVVTDRDIVIRVVAQGQSPDTPVREACSAGDLASVAPDTGIEQAVQLMRSKAVRRLPVLQGGKPVGILSIGDLAMEKDPNSALADISAAEGNA